MSFRASRQKMVSGTSATMTDSPRLSTFLVSLVLVILLLPWADAQAARPQTIQQQMRGGRSISSTRFVPKIVAESDLMAQTSPLRTIPMPTTESYPKIPVVLVRNLTEAASRRPAGSSGPAVAATSGEMLRDGVKRLLQNKKLRQAVLSNFMNGTTKQWLPTGNELWDSLISHCMTRPTFSCFQKNIYTYLDRTLLLADVNVTDNFLLLHNQVNYTDQLIKSNEIDVSSVSDPVDDPEIVKRRSLNGGDDDTTAESPLEEVTNALYGKGVKFAMTHDIQLKMPKMLFDGSILRISPRSFEGNGALIKIELEPDTSELQNSHGTGRLLLKKLKKIFKNKLLLSFLAIVLVIKLIKIKLLWLLPILVGVGTAKKLVLKFLLFLFPALSHIFKLCSWYHHNYHQTKFHHHNHQISHLHTVVPPWFEQHGGGHGAHHESAPLIYTKPPIGHPSEYLHGAPPFQHSQPDWELSGPGLGSEYIGDINRNAHVGFEPKFDDLKEMKMWGLVSNSNPPPSTTSHSINTNPLTQSSPSKLLSNSLGIKSPTATRIASQYQSQLDPRQNVNAANLANVDPFYGPILVKIDSIFAQLGIQDEPCKERLLCSMYKNPTRYSPHSNFISAELSRDANDLQKPANTNIAVMRFYRYIQAARDGQDMKDCLAFYPQCNINTEQRR